MTLLDLVPSQPLQRILDRLRIEILRYLLYILLFFFSSRRRHTRFDCDWSSDVCSSDLAPMLGNLVKKGFGVIAYDVVPAALANAEKRGATRAESGADAARRSDLVITMLPSSSHVETAYLGKNGIAEGVTAGRPCVDMSTIDPAVSRP